MHAGPECALYTDCSGDEVCKAGVCGMPLHRTPKVSLCPCIKFALSSPRVNDQCYSGCSMNGALVAPAALCRTVPRGMCAHSYEMPFCLGLELWFHSMRPMPESARYTLTYFTACRTRRVHVPRRLRYSWSVLPLRCVWRYALACVPPLTAGWVS